MEIPEVNNRTKSADNIELRSLDVQEILGRPPRWIIRWGICVIFGVIMVLLIGSVFFRYPDVIISEVTLTTEHPAVWVISKSTGKIQQLFINDNEKVNTNDLLAVVENPACYNDVENLKEYLNLIKPFFEDYFVTYLTPPNSNYTLGDLQDVYMQFFTITANYIHFSEQQYHQKRIEAKRQELKGQKIYLKRLKNQEKLQKENLALIQKQYDREDKLFQQKVISPVEHENAEKTLLAAKQSLEQALLNISNAEITINNLSHGIMELKLDYASQLKDLKNQISTNYEILKARISLWEQQHLLKATASGNITFNKIWSKNQHINIGDKVFGIVAENPGEIIGKVQLPAIGAGKVKVGQRANIKLDSYPYMEYGMILSSVQSISLVPDEKMYSVQLLLPNNLKTFYGEDIGFTGELTGIVEIVTDDISLFQRLLNPLKYFFKRNT